MNKRKWTRKSVPVSMLALKLCEEAGEVAREITDAKIDGKPYDENVLTELDHVIFIASIMRERLQLRKDLKKRG